MKIIITKNENETLDLAIKIAKYIKPADCILLEGDLGAGKTTFTKGLAKGLGIDKNISSPSFTILKQYEIDSNTVFNHLDLYRLEGSLSDFDLEEYIDDKDSITVIEWPFLVKDILPKEYLLLTISYLNDNEREFKISAIGKKYERIVEAL